MDQHFETEYTGADTFEEKNRRNADIIRSKYLPFMIAAGLTVIPKVDADPIELSPYAKASYPNPVDFNARNGIRPPDVMGIDQRMRIANAPSLDTAYFEVKDFPQTSLHNASGCEVRLVRRYLGIQHLFHMPVVMLFMDRDVPATPSLPYALDSAFKENGEYIPYGGLLWDLLLHDKSMSPRIKHKGETRNSPQIIWQVQDLEKKRIMRPINEIAESLRSGKVRMESMDPTSHPLWKSIHNVYWWGEWGVKKEDMPRMVVPPGGLTVFTENP